MFAAVMKPTTALLVHLTGAGAGVAAAVMVSAVAFAAVVSTPFATSSLLFLQAPTAAVSSSPATASLVIRNMLDILRGVRFVASTTFARVAPEATKGPAFSPGPRVKILSRAWARWRTGLSSP
jgi:hypothetical protein